MNNHFFPAISRLRSTSLTLFLQSALAKPYSHSALAEQQSFFMNPQR